MSDSKQIFLVPLHDIKAFMKFLAGQSYDINEVEPEHLEYLWEDYCNLKVQQGEEWLLTNTYL